MAPFQIRGIDIVDLCRRRISFNLQAQPLRANKASSTHWGVDAIIGCMNLSRYSSRRHILRMMKGSVQRVRFPFCRISFESHVVAAGTRLTESSRVKSLFMRSDFRRVGAMSASRLSNVGDNVASAWERVCFTTLLQQILNRGNVMSHDGSS